MLSPFSCGRESQCISEPATLRREAHRASSRRSTWPASCPSWAPVFCTAEESAPFAWLIRRSRGEIWPGVDTDRACFQDGLATGDDTGREEIRGDLLVILPGRA